MKITACFIALFTIVSGGVATAQEVIIKGTLRCTNGAVTSTKGAVNIIIIPSFNPKAAVATTTTPEGFFQVNTGWDAKDLKDKEVSLYIITKCTSCQKIQRVFISEDLDKRNTDPTKMYVTVKGWKILENCKETELPDMLSAKLLDSAYKLPAEPVSGKAAGSFAVSPVSFINLFTKLAAIAGAPVGVGYFQVYNIPPGQIKYGNFLHSSPITNTDNTGFNFAPTTRNLSEAVFWNPSAIAFANKPYNISLLSNFKNNIKLSGYQQITKNFYIGLGGIYTKQDESRSVTFFQVNVDTSFTNIPHKEKLEEFAAFVAPVYKVNNQLSIGASFKSIWQQFNNPYSAALVFDNNGNLQTFIKDDSIKTQHFDADISVSYKINSSLQAGVSIMNIAGTQLYSDIYIKGNTPTYINQRAYGAGLTYIRGRINVGVDALFTDKEFYDASLGVNYVPFNNALIAAGYSFKQQSFSLSFRLRHFKIAYIDDNNLVINKVRVSKSSIFNGKIYTGFVFDF